MPHTIQIEVNQKHIQKGVAMDINCCPIAIAIAEKFHRHYGCVFDSAGMLGVIHEDENSRKQRFAGYYQPDESVYAWVRRYDDQVDVSAGTLVLYKSDSYYDGNTCSFNELGMATVANYKGD